MKQMPLSRSAFEAIDPSRRFNYTQYSNYYMLLDFESGGVYGIAWEKELLPPVVFDDFNVWVGVDRCLVVLEKATGLNLITHVLATGFQKFIHFEDAMIVLCETDVLAFNNDLSIRIVKYVGDVITDIRREGDCLEVDTIGGQCIKMQF